MWNVVEMEKNVAIFIPSEGLGLKQIMNFFALGDYAIEGKEDQVISIYIFRKIKWPKATFFHIQIIYQITMPYNLEECPKLIEKLSHKFEKYERKWWLRKCIHIFRGFSHKISQSYQCLVFFTASNDPFIYDE